jgi:hypothetical protein
MSTFEVCYLTLLEELVVLNRHRLAIDRGDDQASSFGAWSTLISSVDLHHSLIYFRAKFNGFALVFNLDLKIR